MAFGIAVLGLDHWYTAFGVLDNTHKNASATLVGVWDKDASRRAEITAKYPDVLVVGEADALLRWDDVDLVCVCAATDEAVPLCKSALKAGKHVLSVKPPARTLVELDGVLSVAPGSGKFYGSFEGMQRLQPKNVKLRELLQSGAIGNPLSYHHVAHGGLPSPWPGKPGGAPSWWLDKNKVPGGAWIDHAIYAVDLARFVFDGEITQAHGIMGRRTHPGLSVEDYGVSLMRLSRKNGVGGDVALMFEDTWANESGGGGASTNRTQFIGTKGSIVPDGDGWIVKSGGKETRHEIAASTYFQMSKLAEILQSGGKMPMPFDAKDARANLAACLSVYDAAKS